MNMNDRIDALRRFIGTILAIATGVALAWYWVFVVRQVAGLGGLGTIAVFALGVLLIVITIVWPEGRAPGWRRFVTALVVITLLVGLEFGWGKGIAEMANSMDWGGFFIGLAWLLGVLAWLVFLFGLIILRHPLDTVRTVFRRR